MLEQLPDGVYAAGEVAGAATLEAAELSGAIAGREAAHGARLRRRRRARRADAERELLASGDGQPPEVAVPPARRAAGGKGKCFACLCEDVTAKDIHLLGRGGLRLDRAVQALHDRDDGPVPGPHVPAARGAR